MEELKHTGLHLQTMFSTLMATYLNKSLFKALDSCFNLRTISLNPISVDRVRILQSLTGVSGLSSVDTLKGYKSVQNFTKNQIPTQSQNYDREKHLEATRIDKQQLVVVSLKAIEIPYFNADSDRLFPNYGEVLTDL
ncbi:uncharacterized protein LOC126185205 [Schistocerca cancellata]|uniref:uncharacterized protein LOC126185205 n=1 Tax=Schistocerca cancellata TaxID=274614 RepID=UPI0021180D32|nr:uncharacterized protein LOC126185205 [Schistocerca cancellata]